MSALRVVAIPLVTTFRGTVVREAALLSQARPDGAVAWAEWSPFLEYDDQAAARWLRAAQEALAGGWPAPRRAQVPVNTTVPASLSAEAAAAFVAASGCTTAKVKVGEAGQTLDDDVARVGAVRDALGPRGRLRVDVNGAWDAATAAHRLGVLAEFDLEYAEQPCATWAEMGALRSLTAVPLAADELVRLAPDPLAAARRVREVADVVVLKVQPVGGVRAALAIAEAALVPAVVSSALETSVGLAAGVALAAALPDLPYACGLGTATLLSGDVTRSPLLPVDGHLRVVPVEPATELLDLWAASREVVDRWEARLVRAQAQLPSARA